MQDDRRCCCTGPCSQDAAPKALENTYIAYKCYCLGLLVIVKNKSYDVLKKDGYISTWNHHLFDKYVQCILEIMWKTYCRNSVTIRVTNVLEYIEVKLYACDTNLSLNFMAHFYAVRGNTKTFKYMDFYCTKTINAPKSIGTG